MNTEQLEKAIKCCLSGSCTGCPRQAKKYPALRADCKDLLYDYILSALRARQERENGCEYCDFSSGATGACIGNVGDSFILIQSENGVSIATDDAHFKMLNITFCPMCGRKLEQKESQP
jgi:hypothetical protein